MVTPVQMAHAIATLANKGKRIRPHTVSTIGFPDGSLINPEPEILPPVVASDANWEIVYQGMFAVVQGPRGTARYIANSRYHIAGKTGTAQVFSLPPTAKYHPNLVADHLRDHSLFLGFAPAEDPKIAVAVIVENKKKKSGAMVAKEVLDAYLVPPELLAAEAAEKTAKAAAAAAAAALSAADPQHEHEAEPAAEPPGSDH
jgi:penicillin-binding protein 2